MNNPLVLYVIGGLLVAFFIFLLVMCWKTWRFMHIFFSFLVFVGAVAFLWLASMTLKTHNNWRTPYEAYTKEIAKAEAEMQGYLHGDLTDVEQSEDSLRSLRAELDRELVDRGRVWRECTPMQAVDADTFQVRTVPASLPQGTNPTPNGILAQTVLYAFAEVDSPDGWKVPATYLGEFSVDAAAPDGVTISAMLPLHLDQVEKIKEPGATWALYEIMPLDGHEIFAEMDDTEKRMLGMDLVDLRNYIPNQFNRAPNEYDGLLEQFHRFNREATEDDPPENTWVLVKFVKAHSIQVDSDAEQSLLDPDGRYFDTSGRAVEGRVRRGEEGTVEFEVADTAVFDLDTADTLIADGVCEKVKPVFRRDLHDYARFFREARDRHIELDDSIARADRELATYLDLKAKVDADILVYNKEKVDLEKDLLGFQREREEATAYAHALHMEWQKALKQLSDLYQANNKLADELTQLQRQLAIEINRRTAEATARASSTATSSQ